MAHERGDLSRAGRKPDRDASAEELQRLLRERRESITQTVEEIKMTMNSGFQDTKQQVSQTFDWRHQMRQHPLAAVAGALAVGFVAGQLLGRAFSAGGSRIRHARIRRETEREATPSRAATGTAFGAGTSLAPQSRPTFESARASASPTPQQRAEHPARPERLREPREPRRFISPAVKSRVGGRFEETLSDIAENFLSEVSRIGRDVVIPTILGRLSAAFTQERPHIPGGQQPRSSGPRSGPQSSSGIHGTAAGGPIGGQPDEDQGGSFFQGRGI